MSRIRLTTVSVILCLGIAQPAYAYLDPGTASIILQGVIGGGVVAVSAVALYWRRFTSWIKGEKRQPDEDRPDGPES